MCDRFLHPSRHNRWQKPFRRYQKILKINLTNFANIFKNFRDFCFFSAWDFHFSMSVFSRTTNSIQTNINSIISKRFLAILISQMASSRWSAAWMFEKKNCVISQHFFLFDVENVDRRTWHRPDGGLVQLQKLMRSKTSDLEKKSFRRFLSLKVRGSTLNRSSERERVV